MEKISDCARQLSKANKEYSTIMSKPHTNDNAEKRKKLEKQIIEYNRMFHQEYLTLSPTQREQFKDGMISDDIRTRALYLDFKISGS
jgi:hypothetical protein